MTARMSRTSARLSLLAASVMAALPSLSNRRAAHEEVDVWFSGIEISGLGTLRIIDRRIIRDA